MHYSKFQVYFTHSAVKVFGPLFMIKTFFLHEYDIKHHQSFSLALVLLVSLVQRIHMQIILIVYSVNGLSSLCPCACTSNNNKQLYLFLVECFMIM